MPEIEYVNLGFRSLSIQTSYILSYTGFSVWTKAWIWITKFPKTIYSRMVYLCCSYRVC
jgi:hypothetical protein